MIFAASIALALNFTNIQKDELPRKGALGVSFSPLNAEEIKKLGIDAPLVLKAGVVDAKLTASKAGLMSGDLVFAINGKKLAPGIVGATVRNTAIGENFTFNVLRNGNKIDLTSPLTEKLREPTNAKYEVTYSHVVSFGKKMRTIITHPRSSGKHPALFFIQGYSGVTIDFALSTATGDGSSVAGPILRDFAEDNFVTIRVEKPGIGDSEGGAFSDLDYLTELDIYRQALKQLKLQKDVDENNVFIFGHSMGGCFGPMVASENPVKGITAYGTAGRTWYEYFLDNSRSQNLLAGATYQDTDTDLRITSRIFAMAFLENMSASDIKKAHPDLAEATDAMFPNGMMNNKTLEYWRQLSQINFPDYWAKCNTHVLAVRGLTDFVSYDSDHSLIAETVNSVKPGWGKFINIPQIDHLFHNFKSKKESQLNFGKGQYTPSFSKILKTWVRGVMNEKTK
jgi:pimeloyl-ACP methyl ester carboxylesterase